MDRNRIMALLGSLLTFIVVGLVAIQLMYYMEGYPPTANMLHHQFLVTIGFLFGVVAASYVYTHIKEDTGSSWVYEDENKDKGEDEDEKY